MIYTKDNLIKIYENLFNPIDNKDYGLYWFVSNNKRKPLANAEELLEYVKEERPEGTFISRYANLTSILILENNIYLDFDLKAKLYLKAEKGLTEEYLEEELVKEVITIEESDNYNAKNDKNILKSIQKKFKKDFTLKNGFSKGFNNFIDSLTEAEAKAIQSKVRDKEKEELKGKSKNEVQKYYLNKLEEDYLKIPFNEAVATAKYFESIGIKTILNWSGSKGLALRIPITQITFEGTELEYNSEAVKIFLKNLAELIETKILGKSKNTSCLDYAVFCKGIQRIPTSQHNKTKLYANFIDPSFNYLEAIDYLAINPITDIDKLDYFPEEIDREQNTKLFLETDIYKATLQNAIEETNLQTYSSEVGNVAYNFKSENHKKLKEIILEIYPESLNFFPYKVIHLLKRTGFSKEEVEAIFRDVEPDKYKYNKHIKGNIKYAFENPNAKICGLKNLIQWIETNYPNHEKDNVIDYFKTNFEYYETPNEEKLNEKFYYNEKEYDLYLFKLTNTNYYVVKDFIKPDIILEIHTSNKYILLRNEKEAIGKLRLKKTIEGLEPVTTAVKRFSIKLKSKNLDIDVEELIEELDLLFTDSNILKNIEISNKGNPVEILKNKPNDNGALMNFSKIIEQEAKISVAYNPNTKKNEHYIYNNGYFEKLKQPILHKFIEEHYDLRLPATEVKTLINSIPINNTFHNEYFQFNNNIFFNGITGEFIEKEEEYLTDKKVGMLVDGEYKLINRLTEEELEKDTKENGYSALETLVFTIMSVYKDKNESIRRYKGFLEWLGYIFRPVNTNKKIINLQGLGDDAKTTLIQVLIKLVPEYSVVILPTELDKGFTESMIGNNHLIVFDEAKTDEIVKHENFFKNASNGRSNRSSRQMYTEETIDNLTFGLIFILSNTVIGFNTSDESLMEREDIVKMLRRFKQDPNIKKGELKAKDIDHILNNDFKGFERIVNYGIIQYNKIRDKKNFELSTSITETKEIILDNDILSKFLALKTRYDKATATTNEELTTAFILWSEKEKIDLSKHFTYKNEKSLKTFLKRELGKKIKEHYRNIKEEELVEVNENRVKQYRIRILTNSEVTERDNKNYCINEEPTIVAGVKGLTGKDKLVYEAVHRLEIASVNKLLEETDVPEIELIETLTNLVTWKYLEEV